MESKKITKFLFVLAVALFAWQGQMMAQTFMGAGNPQPIPMTGTGGFPCTGGPTTSDAAVSLAAVNGSTAVGTAYIIDNVTLDLTHTFDSDLDIDLISPSGTVWDLSSDNGGAGNNYTMTVFQDGAPSITTGSPPFTGTFQAEQGPFATGFAGNEVNGNWQLSICDDTGGDTGTLLSWSITFVAIECEFVGLPASPVIRSNDAGTCEACITFPAVTANGAACAGISDPNSAVALGPVTQDLNFVGGDLVATPITVGGAVANAPAGSTVTISGNWNTDNGFATESPTFTLEGTLIGNLPAGVTGDCAANGFSFDISAADYNAAAADGNLDFVVGADPDVDLFCATNNITVEVAYFTAVVPFTNDFNGTTDASGCYPVGTTTVCYTTNLTVGGQVTSCFDVIVNDTEGPTFTNCPGSSVINLDPGDCEYIFDYTPEAEDNCPAMPVTFNLGSTAGTQNINCNIFNVSTGNQHFRSFVETQALLYDNVTILQGINAAGGMITANVYTNDATFPAGNLSLIATGTAMSTGVNGDFLDIPLTASATSIPGQEVVVEIIVPQGIVFFPLYGAGQNGPTWLQAAGCGAPTPTDVNGFGITNGLGMTLSGIPQGLDIVQTAGPVSGTSLPVGVYDFRFEATDAAGNIGVCEFTLEVKEFPNAVTFLGCNDNVQISLDENCEAIVGADLILEGGPYACYDTRYGVSIDKNGDGRYTEDNLLDASNVGGAYNVKVTDLVTGNSCWGSIIVEDKLVPDLTCEELTLSCSADLTPGQPIASSLSATLNSGDSWASVGSFDQELDLAGAPSGSTVTDVDVSVDLTHTWVGDVNITVVSPSGTEVVALMGQCGIADDIDATFDDQAAGPIACAGTPVISGTVQPENPFAAFNGEDPNGQWIVRIADNIAGDGGTINEVSIKVSFAGTNNFPVPAGATVFQTPAQQGSNEYTVSGFDACGDAILSYEDDTDNFVCQDIVSVITRTWTVTDESGNTKSCDQTINLTLATLADVTTPPDFDGINQPALLCENRCGDAAEQADTRFCGPSNLYWNIIPDGQPYAGHPSPDDGATWGCGQVKCFGTGRPGGTCGNINATFADTRLNICTSGPSEGCYKILRRWTILDWCTGDVAFHNQTIKVEDNEGPQIADIEDLTISVDIWGCEADWYATEPWLMDNCSSDPLNYTVSSTGGTVELLPDGRYRILDLVPGVYDVTYTATDCCGNVSDSTIQLTVLDDVAPVAVCDGSTVVSISRTTNIQDDNLGLTKIFATTFDDGSYDNCSDDVWFKVIRMDEYDSNGNGKFPETVREGDWASIDCDAANGDDDLRTIPSFYRGPQSYFDDYVKFCCADIEDGPIMVVFRVYDVDPEPFTFGKVFPNLVPAGENPDDYNGVLPEAQDVGGALYGRYDDCMVEVEVQDKLPPYVVAPPPITVTCDYWFPFDADNPNDYTDELDAIFGKVVEGSADPLDRDSIVITDRVCPAHPRFAEFAPASIFDDPCYDDKYDIYWGRDGYVLDNCNIELEQTITPDLHCARGRIIRSWRASDAAGNWSNIARQIITIIDCKEFYVPTACWRFTPKDIGDCDLINGANGLQFLTKLIEWPCDVEINRCQTDGLDAFLPENLAVTFDQDRRPRFDDDNCNLLGATYVDRSFTFVDNACVKIFRDWTVIDWCLYEDFQAGVYSGPFEWEWTQVIKLLNTEGPVFDDCSDREFCGFGDPAFPNNNQCVGEVVLEPGITDDCTDLSEIRTDYKIDAFNDGGFDILGYSNNHPVNPFGIGASATQYDASNPNANGKYPVGTHRILWTAEDGCGNITTCEYTFTVQDCKPPTPYCRNGVSTIPMPQQAGGYVDIWASDYNIGSYDNCTAQDDLIYSFSDDPTDFARRFTCADAPGLYNLTVYVWDLGLDGLPRNFATCEVTIQLTDCANQTTYNVAGAIETEAGVEASDVNVVISGDDSADMMTDNAGTYGFALEADQNYVVTPVKDVDHRNGISTFDLVTISKHISGQQALNSPYKMIAADVNNTGSITTFDIIELRKLILYINTEFPDNTSWRFVDADFDFVNGDPFASTFPETYTINDLNQHMDINWVAVKVGDVNESARANAMHRPAGTRSAGELNFNVKDQAIAAGETVTVDFTAADFANVLGYQFTLNYSDAVSVEEVTGAALGLNEGNFGQLSNAVTTSWNASKAASLASDEVVFSITLTANEATTLSEALSITSEYTAAEAYNAAGQLNVNLNFTRESSDFALFQNQPNPFAGSTVIGFNLPQAGTATLSIYDVSGKVLSVIEGDYSKGYNQVTVERSELSGAGVLYYTLDTQNESATKKMILVD